MPHAAASRRALLAAAAGGAAFAAAPLRAQPAWKPSRTVTIIVPFGAGSGTDAISRILATLLEPEWGRRRDRRPTATR